MTDVLSEAPTALYRLRDRVGALLYVGIARDPWRRFTQHAGEKSWWTSVVQVEIEWYPARELAAQAERDAIRIEMPQHNILCRITAEQWAALEEAQAAWDEFDRLTNAAWTATESLRGLGIPDLTICGHIRQVSKPTLNRKLGPRKPR